MGEISQFAITVDRRRAVINVANQVFDNLLSYKEAARYLSVSESYLRRLKRQGQIAFVLVGRRGVRFKLSSLKSWVDEREIK